MNSIITSNRDLFTMTLQAEEMTRSIYNLSDSTITPIDGDSSGWIYRFQQQGNALIIACPCIEACLHEKK